jgi:hypothetical protein
LPLCACRKVEPAPRELDQLLHFFWAQYDEGDDEYLSEGLVNLDKAIDDQTLEEGIDGTVSDLTQAELEVIGSERKDAAQAQGLFLARNFSCSTSTLAKVLTWPDQGEIYEDAYERYERDFDSSRGDFLDGKDDLLTWTTSYTSAETLGIQYDSRLKGALRRVRGESGTFLLARTYLLEPADFGEDAEDKSFEQDYQVEVYWRRDGAMAHLYGIWRECDFGADAMDIDNEGFQRIVLNSLSDWDDETEEICEAGGP